MTEEEGRVKQERSKKEGKQVRGRWQKKKGKEVGGERRKSKIVKEEIRSSNNRNKELVKTSEKWKYVTNGKELEIFVYAFKVYFQSKRVVLNDALYDIIEISKLTSILAGV